MRNNTILMFAFTMFVFVGCGSENNHNSQNIQTDIPTELSENQKVKEYFETLDQVLAEYANMIEKIAETSNEVENKDEPSFSDAMKMLSDVTTSTMKMAPLIEKMDQLEKEADIMKEDMTPEEVEAFSKTYAKIMSRYYELGKKLEASKQ
jgi:uncharacterized coiled-coil DUF342 family protein